jgi:hypothetical protein
MTRSDIINTLIQKNNYKSYLEIGVNTPAQPGYNWINIKADVKHGVDPEVDTTYRMTSDEFFERHISQSYDFIFVEGLHMFDQCYRDIVNSLKHLKENGTIMVHDSNPLSEITQRPERASDVWHGDVWKAIVKLRLNNENVEIYTIDTDEGCSIIKKGHQKTLKLKENFKEEDMYHYEVLDANRKILLNLITVEEFKKNILNE